MAAKRTSDTIPLCHPLMIASVSVTFELEDDHVAIEADVDCIERTGVEMGSAPRVQRGGADGVRHVQVGGQGDDDHRPRALGEDGWQVRDLPPTGSGRIIGDRLRDMTSVSPVVA